MPNNRRGLIEEMFSSIKSMVYTLEMVATKKHRTIRNEMERTRFLNVLQEIKETSKQVKQVKQRLQNMADEMPYNEENEKECAFHDSIFGINEAFCVLSTINKNPNIHINDAKELVNTSITYLQDTLCYLEFFIS